MIVDIRILDLYRKTAVVYIVREVEAPTLRALCGFRGVDTDERRVPYHRDGEQHRVFLDGEWRRARIGNSRLRKYEREMRGEAG